MTKIITPQMKQFLTELAELMNKHNIEFECVDDPRDNGIEFQQNGEWDIDGNIIRPASWFKIDSRFVNKNDILTTINRSEVTE